MSISGEGIAAHARQFLDGEPYTWGGDPTVSIFAGFLAEMRQAAAAGEEIDEIIERFNVWLRWDFERMYQAFCDARLLNSQVSLPPWPHDPPVS